MTVDSSVIVSIVLKEPSWRELSRKVLTSPSIVGAPTLLECHLVLRSRLGDAADKLLHLTVQSLNIAVVAFGLNHLGEACTAFDHYGKGRHPAALNFGDCISYVISKVSGQPLLFVGEDFHQTDVAVANG